MHTLKHTHTHTLMQSHTDKWTHPATSAHTHLFLIPLKRSISFHITAYVEKVMVSEDLYYIRGVLCIYVTLDSTYGNDDACNAYTMLAWMVSCDMVAIVTHERAIYLYFPFQRRIIAYGKSMSIKRMYEC